MTMESLSSGALDESAETVRRLRAGGAILLALQFVNIAADFYAKPDYAARFFGLHIFSAVLLAGLIALTWITFFARHWQTGALVACSILLAFGTAMSLASHDVIPRFVSVLIFSFGCATFLPWGSLYQAMLNSVCLLSFVVDVLYAGHLPRDSIFLWVGLATTLILSQSVALYSERARAALLASAEQIAARDAAIESARLKSLFLATMSHEIRTPLHIILTYSSVIEMHLAKSGDEKQMRALHAIKRAGERLNRTVDHILDISRLEAGAFELKRAPLDVPAVTARLVEDFKPLAREKGLELTWEASPEHATLVFDEYCLTQALSNLIDNAIKFTETGRISVRFFSGPDKRMQMEVRDTGVGIDAAFLPRIFEPFSQEELEYSRRFQGAGLGLALVKRYLALNGAEVSVTSDKGSGTRFLIRFARE